jgi:hypothetical protein
MHIPNNYLNHGDLSFFSPYKFRLRLFQTFPYYKLDLLSCSVFLYKKSMVVFVMQLDHIMFRCIVKTIYIYMCVCKKSQDNL